jgi:hypothetical protein
MMDKYGLPQEVTATHLVWHNNGPWKMTIVYRKVSCSVQSPPLVTCVLAHTWLRIHLLEPDGIPPPWPR